MIQTYSNALTEMTTPGGIDKWMRFELTRINKGIVTRKKKLSILLNEEKPQCTTKEGDTYEFDRIILVQIASVLEKGQDLQLPITLHFSSRMKDHCYIDDETAATMIRKLEELGEAYRYRDGKMWLPNSLAYTLMQKYRTMFQGLFL